MDETGKPAEYADLERVGVIDVGSNSVRLVVFDGAARSPAYFYNEKVLCGLGRGIAESGRLFPEGRTRALAAMERFAALCDSFNVGSLHTVATAAVRDASDGPEFVDEVQARSGIRLTIASGTEEARLSAQGVLLGWPEADGLVCDIGGASLELAEVSAGKVGRCITSPLGPLQLLDLPGGVHAIARRAAEHLARMRQKIDGSYGTLYLVGGSFRALAKLDMARRGYPLEVLHEYLLDRESLRDTLEWLASSTPEELAAETGSSSERIPLLPTVAIVLRQLVQMFEPDFAAISSYGIREGLLYEQMPPDLRARDPLIEACTNMEASAARFPGFGAKLAAWLDPLLPDTAYWQRMTMAASLLHDVSWRSHPSSRAEECFDNASRGNLGGLDHPGRVLLAMALLHRYKKSGNIDKYHALAPLLSEEDRRNALILGRGLRLGAALAGGDAQVLTDTPLVLGEDRLTLRLTGRNARFAGEAVTNRLTSLAEAVGRTGVMETA